MISCLVIPVVPSSSMLRVVMMETGENRALPVPSSLTAFSTIDMVRFQMASEALRVTIINTLRVTINTINVHLKAGGGSGVVVSGSPKAFLTPRPLSRCPNLSSASDTSILCIRSCALSEDHDDGHYSCYPDCHLHH